MKKKEQEHVNDLVLGNSFALMHKLFNAPTVHAVGALLSSADLVRLALRNAVALEEEGPRKRLLARVQTIIDGYTAMQTDDELERYHHVIRPVQKKIEELTA